MPEEQASLKPGEPKPPKGIAQVWTRAVLSFLVWIPLTLAFWLGTASIPFFRPLIDVMPDGARGNYIAFVTVLLGVLGVIVQYFGYERIKALHLKRALLTLASIFAVSFVLLLVAVENAIVRVDVPAVGRPASFAVGFGARPANCYCDSNPACPNGKSMGDAECIEKCLTLSNSAVESCWGRSRMSGARTILLAAYLVVMLSAGSLVAVLVLREKGRQPSKRGGGRR